MYCFKSLSALSLFLTLLACNPNKDGIVGGKMKLLRDEPISVRSSDGSVWQLWDGPLEFEFSSGPVLHLSVWGDRFAEIDIPKKSFRNEDEIVAGRQATGQEFDLVTYRTEVPSNDPSTTQYITLECTSPCEFKVEHCVKFKWTTGECIDYRETIEKGHMNGSQRIINRIDHYLARYEAKFFKGDQALGVFSGESEKLKRSTLVSDSGCVPQTYTCIKD